MLQNFSISPTNLEKKKIMFRQKHYFFFFMWQKV